MPTTKDEILGKVGIRPRGEYNAATKYLQSDFTYYAGSTYLCINKDGCTGITPSHDKINWIFLARGTTENTIASATGLGLVQVGKGLSITEDGILSADVQEVGVATAEKAGIVKVGTGIQLGTDGTISIPTCGALAGRA